MGFSRCPFRPCMVYFSTCTIKINQREVIYHTWILWDLNLQYLMFEMGLSVYSGPNSSDQTAQQSFFSQFPDEVSIIPLHGFRWMTGGWNYGAGRTRVGGTLEKFYCLGCHGSSNLLSFESLSVKQHVFLQDLEHPPPT